MGITPPPPLAGFKIESARISNGATSISVWRGVCSALPLQKRFVSRLMNKKDHMNRDVVKWLFTIIFLVAVPALVHSLYQGAYKGASGGTNVIGPICTTIPYLFLVILFLANCFDLKARSRRTAYCGAIMAWLAMMAVTLSIMSRSSQSKFASRWNDCGSDPPCLYSFSRYSIYRWSDHWQNLDKMDRQ